MKAWAKVAVEEEERENYYRPTKVQINQLMAAEWFDDTNVLNSNFSFDFLSSHNCDYQISITSVI